MSRALITILTDADRKRATAWAWDAPVGTRIEWKAPKPTPDDWKLVFLDALKREVRIVPNLDGTGFVSLTKSSSDLSKQEMSDLLEIITAWGVKNGVVFHDEQEQAA